MTDVPHDLDYDSKVQRLKRRYQGLSRVAAAINDLYIYGVLSKYNAVKYI